MKLATSMWSGPIVCSAPPSLSRPWTVITFEPMPSTWAPILISRRARSWTWGSQAALWIVVGPGVRAAASSAFSVPITEGSSMKMSEGRRPPSGALSSIQRSPSTLAPRSRKASRCGSRRRRPIRSPPGGGMRASPKRASSGPASRKEARIWLAVSSSTSVPATASARSRTELSAIQSTATPSRCSSVSWASVSRIRGTLWIVTLLLGQQAGGEDRQRRVLVARGDDLARAGQPPWITNLSMLRAGLGWAPPEADRAVLG